MLNDAALRPLLYRLAAGLFNQPTADRLALARTLTDTLLTQPPAGEPWREPLTMLATALDYNLELEAEYSRLFVLGRARAAAQPFASHWLEEGGRLMGDSTLEVRRLMGRYGLGPAPGSGLLPDHISVELEFMGFLAAEAQALRTDPDQRAMVEGHLARWIPPFLCAVRRATRQPLYARAADFLEALIAAERTHLSAGSKPSVPEGVTDATA